jgi:hypothetical protein
MPPDLRILLFDHRVDRQIEGTSQARNLKIGEPDANLFRVPPGYSVVNEEASFTMQYLRAWGIPSL